MKRIFSISLALLILVSNVGFAMNTHFCGGEAVELSFTLGLHNLDCGMTNMDQLCENDRSDDEVIQSNPCCENQHLMLQLDENAELLASAANVNPVFFLSFVQTLVQSMLFTDQDSIHYTDYSPPLPEKNVRVLFQTFLI